MLEIDLSSLNPADLRRIAKAARARGDTPLADRVEREIVKRSAPGRGAAGIGAAQIGAAQIGTAPAGPGPEPARLVGPIEEPEPERRPGAWRTAAFLAVGVAVGVAVGSAATAGGIWALERRAHADTPAVTVTESPAATPQVAVLTAAPVADLPQAGAPPVVEAAAMPAARAATRTARRPAKARTGGAAPASEVVDDADLLARAYETGVRDLDAARGRPEDPIF